MNCRIRIAEPADAAAILDIYAPYIRNTSLTFETEVPTVSAFAERIQKYLEGWPWLLCETDGRVAGYAYASRYRERTGYQWCTEVSVYIHDDYHHRGMGRALYTALLEILRRQGFHNVYAVINLPNANSVAFHESMGFVYFATYENVGFKLGKWKTVGWWRFVANAYGDAPPAPVSFASLQKDFLAPLFRQCSALIK